MKTLYSHVSIRRAQMSLNPNIEQHFSSLNVDVFAEFILRYDHTIFLYVKEHLILYAFNQSYLSILSGHITLVVLS